MDVDVPSVDHVLATTRAVRRRLDLDRPVDLQTIYDCIDLAEQAPTGGNQGSRRWIVVRDPDVKVRLAELYRSTIGDFVLGAHERLAGTGHPNEKVMASAAHLVHHLADVPVIVIPTIIGRHDGSGRPGLFDSVIQSAWSFCLALRARGLGTAWTTAIFGEHDAVRDLLGIPDGMTEIVMLPVAHTIGTDFRPAPRFPARDITFVDAYARTFERGPSDPVRLADGPGAVAEIDIDAPTSAVWPLVTDIDVPARFSEEFLGASWADGDAPALGASFTGRNSHPRIGEWEVPCFVDEFEERRRFGWRTSDRDRPGARWRFELEAIAGATRLRYRVVLGPGGSGLTDAIDRSPEREADIIDGRLRQLHRNMTAVVAGIKALAE